MSAQGTSVLSDIRDLNSLPKPKNTYHTQLRTPSTMRAVRYHGKEDIRLEEVEEPQCGRGQVKIKPAFVGICGSDLHEYIAGPVLAPSPNKPHALTGATLPVCLGHELSGTVSEIGDGVTNVQPGDRVTVRPTIYDGTCGACRQGHYHCCDNIGFIGLCGYGGGGGMADSLVAPSGHFFPIPDNIPLDVAAMIEPLAVAWHAVDVSPFKSGDNVLIVGGGPIGIAVAQILKIRGAKNIIVSEMTPARKELATKYGATGVFDPSQEDVASHIKRMTNDVGVDIAFDAAGAQGGLDAALSAIRAKGTVVNIAVWEKKPAIQANNLMLNELGYIGAALYDEKAFTGVIDALASGTLRPEGMITGRVTMDKAQEAFQSLIHDKDEHVKILVDVQG